MSKENLNPLTEQEAAMEIGRVVDTIMEPEMRLAQEQPDLFRMHDTRLGVMDPAFRQAWETYLLGRKRDDWLIRYELRSRDGRAGAWVRTDYDSLKAREWSLYGLRADNQYYEGSIAKLGEGITIKLSEIDGAATLQEASMAFMTRNTSEQWTVWPRGGTEAARFLAESEMDQWGTLMETLVRLKQLDQVMVAWLLAGRCVLESWELEEAETIANPTGRAVVYGGPYFHTHSWMLLPVENLLGREVGSIMAEKNVWGDQVRIGFPSPMQLFDAFANPEGWGVAKRGGR